MTESKPKLVRGQRPGDDARRDGHACFDQHPPDRELLQANGLPVRAVQRARARRGRGVRHFVPSPIASSSSGA